MSYITPNTTVHLLRGCPIDSDYTNTLYFKNLTEQYNYFYSLKKHTLSNQTYQRWDKGVIRVNLLVDRVYDCNYMIFRNTAYGDKWFYAFIDRVEYVNDVTCAIYYTIDVMQTWYFDYDTGQCFVEREHTETDELWEHYEVENLPIGDLVNEDIEGEYVDGTYLKDDNDNYLLISTVGSIGSSAILPFAFNYSSKNYYCGCYQGYKYLSLPLTDDIIPTYTDLFNVIETNLNDDIINVYLLPKWMCPPPDDDYNINNEKDNYIKTFFVTPYTLSFGNYIPKNNKLYCYPYNSIMVTNNRGSSNIYKYEYFDKSGLNICGFNIESNFVNEPTCIVYPTKYKNIEKNFNECLSINNFPLCSWNKDTTLEWFKENSLNLIATALNTATGYVNRTTLPTNARTNYQIQSQRVTAHQNVLNNTVSNITDIANACMLKNTVEPPASSPILNVKKQTKLFTIYRQRITGVYARIIDEFFTMYGYLINRVKIPNIRNNKIRPHFNYIKTNNCIIKPAQGKGLPAEDCKLISQIYDKGITFWVNANEVGDYSLDNSPITT